MIKTTPEGWKVFEDDTYITAMIEEQKRLDIWEDNYKNLTKLIPRDGVVADIGGYVGDTALTFAKMVGNTGTVHVFECMPDAVECIRHNVGRLDGIIIHPYGLGSKTYGGKIEIPIVSCTAYIVEDSTGTVIVKRFDDVAKDWDRLDFIKIDVEGMELEVLKGAAETIKRLKPAICIEINPTTLCRFNTSAQAVGEFLIELGYKKESFQKISYSDVYWDVIATF